MKTRSHTRKLLDISGRRLKTSNCRGKSYTRCRIKDGCKLTKVGSRKSYCRTLKNRSR